jgi:hypothetical protein
MVVELGHFALVLALIVALVQTVVPMIGAQRGWRGWMAVAEPAATAQVLLIGFSFAVLTSAFVGSDFSLRLVTANSHTAKPLIYKVSGVWGNHEGSMLLWVLILALFGASAAWFGGQLPAPLRARVLAVQGAIGAAFLGFILFTSNPFLRLEVPPFDGEDLNPLLQDPGLAFHPPFLYLGYVGLSMSFSFAVAALIEGRVDAAWGRWVRPWTLAAWLFLTIGIAMGSWWAYYELGWGGFWFWDPVENASFMPWLIAVALLHSAIVVEKREALKAWTVLLAIHTALFESAPALAVEPFPTVDDGLRALREGRIALLVERPENGSVRYHYDDTNPEGRDARLRADMAVQQSAGRTDPVAAQDEFMREPGSRYIDFLIPGLLGMNLMGGSIWSMGFAIVDARRRKLMKRLMATPMPRHYFLLSFLISRLAMLVVEVGAFLGFAVWVFGVPVRGSLALVAAICVLGTLAFGALGLLLSSRVRTIEAASGLMNLTMLPMWILSGVFFSSQRFPDSVQPFIEALPLPSNSEMTCDSRPSISLE